MGRFVNALIRPEFSSHQETICKQVCKRFARANCDNTFGIMRSFEKQPGELYVQLYNKQKKKENVYCESNSRLRDKQIRKLTTESKRVEKLCRSN